MNDELEQKIKDAHIKLQNNITKILDDFFSEYASEKEDIRFYISRTALNILFESLKTIEKQFSLIPRFTPMQINHIYHQISSWYLLPADDHSLGNMKEKLKIMICGDEE